MDTSHYKKEKYVIEFIEQSTFLSKLYGFSKNMWPV